MTKALLALGAGLVAWAWAAAPAHAQAPLRVLTYNMHWAEGINKRTGRPIRRVELDRVVRDIRSSRADVVALQEAQSYRLPAGTALSQPREIARALGWTTGGVDQHYIFRTGAPRAIWCLRDGRAVLRLIAGRLGRCVRHGNAILSRYRLSAKRSFSLWRPDGDDRDGDALGTVEGRVLVRARIRVGRLALWLFGTHLARESPIAACQLAGALAQARVQGPAVLMADLNMSAQTRTRPNCVEATGRPFDLLRAAGFRERPGVPLSYPVHAPALAADHVLVSEELSILSARAIQNCRRSPGDAVICSSDHRPLLARLAPR